MPNIEITQNVDVWCAKCGAALCNQTDVTYRGRENTPSFLVTPCETCLEKARDEGYEEGKAEGAGE